MKKRESVKLKESTKNAKPEPRNIIRVVILRVHLLYLELKFERRTITIWAKFLVNNFAALRGPSLFCIQNRQLIPVHVRQISFVLIRASMRFVSIIIVCLFFSHFEEVSNVLSIGTSHKKKTHKKYRKETTVKLNPYKPGVLFMGHMQTD